VIAYYVTAVGEARSTLLASFPAGGMISHWQAASSLRKTACLGEAANGVLNEVRLPFCSVRTFDWHRYAAVQ